MSTELESKTLTLEEFIELPDDGNRYELVEGELIERPGPNIKHGRITVKLIAHLLKFLEQLDKEHVPGEVLNNSAFILNPKNAVIPDLAFVSASRLANLNEEAAFSGGPDLAVEVMSPTDKWSEVSDKVQRYLKAGARLVWVIDPFDQGVTVYRPDRPRRLLLPDAWLEGEDVIPGFKMLVADLFR